MISNLNQRPDDPGNRDIAALVLSLGVLAWYIILSFLQESIVDTADGILHYQHARFLFAHPELGFDHWAKPLFTMLASGPAQFGLKSVVLMNALFMGITAWVTYLSARRLHLKFALLAPLFVGIGNSINYVVLSGLTEPMFMLFAAITIYLLLMERWAWMFAVAGSLVLIRPEAIVVIPVVVLYGMYRGQWRKLIHILWVPAVFSLAGYLIADYNLFWIITHQPYGGGDSIYGSGGWLDYFREWYRITSYALLILPVPAVVEMFRNKDHRAERLTLFVIGAGIVLLHVLLWKFGKMGSAGLLRTMVTALPALSLVALLGLNAIPGRFVGAVALIIGVVYLLEFNRANRFPLPISESEVAAGEMAQLVKEKELIRNNIVAYQFATTAFYLDLDPFDTTYTTRLWFLNSTQPGKSLNSGDLLIWDNVTGHREGGISHDVVMADSLLTPIDSVRVGNTRLISFIRK